MTKHFATDRPDTSGLPADERRALLHVWARTLQGKFASGLYDWTDERWRAALSSLAERGYMIEYVYGQVLDEPTTLGGWILAADPDAR